MADRYWVGGTGTWGTTTTNWSATSGGAGGASVPTAADNVFFNVNSNVGTGAFTVTISGTRTCLNFTVSGLDGAMTLAGSTLNINGNIAVSSTTFSTSSGNSIVITGAAAKTISVASASQFSNTSFTHSNGTITFNSSVTVRYWQAGGTGGIVLGSNTFTVATEFYWSTGYTINAGTSTVNIGGQAIGSSSSSGTPYTFNILNFTSTSTNQINTSYNITASSITITSPTSGIRGFRLLGNITTTSLTVTGGSLSSRVIFMGEGSVRTFSTGSITGAGFTGWGSITFAGGASPWSAPNTVWRMDTSVTGITFNTSTLYWIGGTGNWSDTARWSTSSGGTSSGFVPCPQNPVIFNVNSNVGTGAFTATTSATTLDCCGNFTASGLDGVLTLAGTLRLFGSWTSPATNYSATALLLFNQIGGTHTVNTNGATLTTNFMELVKIFDSLAVAPSTIVLGSSMTIGTINFNNQTLNLNGFTLTCTDMQSAGSTSKEIIFNSGTIAITGTVPSLNGNITITQGSGVGTIRFTSTSSTTFSMGPNSNFPVTFEKTSTGALTLTGNPASFDINNIKNTASPCTFNFQAGKQFNFTTFELSGTAGNLVTIQSNSAGTQATLSDSSGINSVQFCSIKDTAATGGAQWNAYTSLGNVNAGNNTGWVFIPPVSANGLFFGSNF